MSEKLTTFVLNTLKMIKSSKNRTKFAKKLAEINKIDAFEQSGNEILDLKLLEQRKEYDIIEETKLLLISGLPRYKIRKEAISLQGMDKWKADIYIQKAAQQIEDEFKELKKLGIGLFFKAYQHIYDEQLKVKDFRGAKETYKTLYEMVYGKPTQVIKQDLTTNAPALTIISEGSKIDLRLDSPKIEPPPEAVE